MDAFDKAQAENPDDEICPECLEIWEQCTCDICPFCGEFVDGWACDCQEEDEEN